MNQHDRWFIVRGATEPPALQKLDALSHYPEGWAHGDGDQFSINVVRSARYALTIAASLGLYGTDVFPRRDGGLVVSIYVDKDVHDFTVYPNGQIEWLHQRDDIDIDSQPTTLEELGSKLVEIARTRWHSYGYWSQPITAHMNEDLKAPHSLNQAVISQSPALTGIAPLPPLGGLVST